MKDLLFKLCSANGTSGDEGEAVNIAKDELIKYADVKIDKNMNLIGTMGEKNSDKHILLDAHIDSVGLVVTYIDDSGFIYFKTCGRIDSRVLKGTMVKIFGKEEITGVIGITPPHLLKLFKGKNKANTELFIDTGLSADKVKSLVSLGDRVLFEETPKSLIGENVVSNALDDRAGVLVLLEVARLLKNEKLNCRVSFLFSAQEETGHTGAHTANYNLKPKEAIVVDVSFATQQDVTKEESVGLNTGPMIGIAPILNNTMSKDLKNLAEINNIPYTLEIMNGRTGTNADDIIISSGGVKVGMISIPLRYMHTPVEVVNLNDIKAIAKLITCYIKKYSEDKI